MRSTHSLEETTPLRAASRRVVRELGFLNGRFGDLAHSECHALVELERSGPLTAGHLAERLVLDKSTVSRLLTKLHKKGWVAPGEDKEDGRKKPFVLTRAGQREVTGIHRAANRTVEEALALMSEQARGKVLEGMTLYARALELRRRQQAFEIRKIKKADDAAMARIIRIVMPEFGCAGAGFAISDPEVDALTAAYRGRRAGFFVLTKDEQVVGGAGFGPLEGGDEATCELRKMYLLGDARGTGMGRRLLQTVLDAAMQASFQRCYLETTPQMTAAQGLYRSMGFERLEAPLGDTGHHGCDVWYAKDL